MVYTARPWPAALRHSAACSPSLQLRTCCAPVLLAASFVRQASLCWAQYQADLAHTADQSRALSGGAVPLLSQATTERVHFAVAGGVVTRLCFKGSLLHC